MISSRSGGLRLSRTERASGFAAQTTKNRKGGIDKVNNANLNSKGDLKILPFVVLGGALFSMHFGAASMIWPMEWGKTAGNQLWAVFAGAFITSLLLVVVAYVALSKTEGSFPIAAKRALGDGFGRVFAVILITAFCPFYGVPRMSAAVWDAFC